MAKYRVSSLKTCVYIGTEIILLPDLSPILSPIASASSFVIVTPIPGADKNIMYILRDALHQRFIAHSGIQFYFNLHAQNSGIYHIYAHVTAMGDEYKLRYSFQIGECIRDLVNSYNLNYGDHGDIGDSNNV